VTLPVPMMNVINGGVHADNSIDLQEFMLVPVGAPTFGEGLRVGAEVYHALKALLHERGLSTAVGDEGGFAPDLDSSEAAIEVILEAAERAGHREDVAIALDPATSEVFRDGAYRFEGRVESGETLAGFWAGIVDRYPVVSLEDGCAEDDWDAWAVLTGELGDRLQLVGDDLFVTSPDRLRDGIARGVANSILVKDQDRCPGAIRPRGEVQPAAQDRGTAWRERPLPRLGGVPAQCCATPLSGSGLRRATARARPASRGQCGADRHAGRCRPGRRSS